MAAPAIATTTRIESASAGDPPPVGLAKPGGGGGVTRQRVRASRSWAAVSQASMIAPVAALPRRPGPIIGTRWRVSRPTSKMIESQPAAATCSRLCASPQGSAPGSRRGCPRAGW